jgi:hypothetical protein
MGPHMNSSPGSFRLAKFAQPLSLMCRADPILSRAIIECGGLSATGKAQGALDLHDAGVGGPHSGLHTSPFPRTSCKMVSQNQMGCPESRSSQVFRKTIRGISISPLIRR